MSKAVLVIDMPEQVCQKCTLCYETEDDEYLCCATGKLLLLDEPVSGLDPKVTAEMYTLIEKLNREDGITVIMISHDVAAAVRYASHILHIGDTAFFGTRADYLQSPQGRLFDAKKGGDSQ